MPEFRGLRSEHATFVQYASGDLEFYDNARDPQQFENAVCRLPAAAVAAGPLAGGSRTVERGHCSTDGREAQSRGVEPRPRHRGEA
jgi:hypothetical protein